MQDECCAKCRFFGQDEKAYYCRRFPPGAAYTRVYQKDIATRFPPVRLDMWCGEFQPVPQPKGPSNA